MTIPDGQSLMAPVLRILADGRDHQTTEIVDRLADELGLSLEERSETLRSGVSKFANRIHWALVYLGGGKLIEKARRGVYRITDKGRAQLAAPEPMLEIPRFAPSHSLAPRVAEHAPPPRPANLPGTVRPTPDEMIALAQSEIERTLRAELLDRIRNLRPDFFERMVVRLLVRMGYGGEEGAAADAIGGSRDGGLDGVIDIDPLGLDRVYVQAKRYGPGNFVGAAQIREFAGALSQAHAGKGVFITTSSFTPDARATCERLPHRIVLIDGDRLAQLMIRHDVGVRIAETLHIKKIDEDFFLEE
jgi:restriction system protein